MKKDTILLPVIAALALILAFVPSHKAYAKSASSTPQSVAPSSQDSDDMTSEDAVPTTAPTRPLPVPSSSSHSIAPVNSNQNLGSKNSGLFLNGETLPAGSALVLQPSTPPAAAPVPPSPPQNTSSANSGFFSKIMSVFSTKNSNGSASSSPFMGASTPVRPAAPPPLPQMDAKSVDPKSLEIAKKIIKSFDVKARLTGTFMSQIAPLAPIVSQGNPTQMGKAQKIAADIADKFAEEHLEDEEKNRAIIYAQTFSYSELEELKSFYESDAGKKSIQLQDQLMSRQGVLDQNLSMSLAPSIRAEFIKQLKKEDFKLPNGFGG